LERLLSWALLGRGSNGTRTAPPLSYSLLAWPRAAPGCPLSGVKRTSNELTTYEYVQQKLKCQDSTYVRLDKKQTKLERDFRDVDAKFGQISERMFLATVLINSLHSALKILKQPSVVFVWASPRTYSFALWFTNSCSHAHATDIKIRQSFPDLAIVAVGIAVLLGPWLSHAAQKGLP
jgi:hypothetical protein